jgi:hypothetical protein
MLRFVRELIALCKRHDRGGGATGWLEPGRPAGRGVAREATASVNDAGGCCSASRRERRGKRRSTSSQHERGAQEGGAARAWRAPRRRPDTRSPPLTSRRLGTVAGRGGAFAPPRLQRVVLEAIHDGPAAGRLKAHSGTWRARARYRHHEHTFLPRACRPGGAPCWPRRDTWKASPPSGLLLVSPVQAEFRR